MIGRYLVNLVKRVIAGEFRVKEPVLDAFLLSRTYRLILIGAAGGDGIHAPSIFFKT
jgi:hypothetical protein